jgi:hypothetical protein
MRGLQGYVTHKDGSCERKKAGPKEKPAKLLICPYCGKVNVDRYRYRQGYCVDCGRIYENFRKLDPSSPRYLEYALYYNAMKKKGCKTPPFILKEGAEMTMETEKTCKQCGKTKTVDNFRKNPARGKGIYKTQQGYHNYCKECEAINTQAIALEKNPNSNTGLYKQLVDYYSALNNAGLGIATAVAARYLGIDKDEAAPHKLTDKLTSIITDLQSDTPDELHVHANKVKLRTYTSLDEARAEHDRLTKKLKEAGMYEEVDIMLEDWELEEDV